MTKKNKKNKKNIQADLSVIHDSDMVEEMKQSYINYAMLVIKGRVLPDVRDGLKPVHRRILYAMNQLQLYPEKQYRKSARIVGDVLGKYHPHGDTAVYNAMVRMAQYFKNVLPLVDGQGNFGSIDGDAPAHMRYTEAKLTKYAMTLLDELDSDVVDFKNNFDDRETEPTVLPNKLPSLLINGTNGVAVGMVTNIPTHNPTEVINAFINYIDNPEISIDKLCNHIPGPDFPTGGIILNGDEFKNNFYYNGESLLRIRSKYHIEDIGYGKKNIVITEVPFTLTGNTGALVSNLLDMVADKRLDECSDVRDESNKDDGIRIVLEVKKGVDINRLMKKLFAKTQIEDSAKYKFLALSAEKEPVVYNLKTYFHDVLEFQKEFYIRKYRKILEASRNKKEILEGYIEANEVIDTIVEIIRNTKAKSKVEASELVKRALIYGDISYLESSNIMKKHLKVAKSFRFTEKQANSILRIQLLSLMNLEIEGYIAELEEVNKRIEFCQNIINNDTELCKVIKKELKALRKEFAMDRKTEICNIEKSVYKNVVLVEEFLVLIDELGYIKLLDVPKNFTPSNFADYTYAKVMKSTDCLRFFTNKGNYIQLKVSNMEKTKSKDRGKLIEAYLELSDDEKILMYDSQNDIVNKELIILTRNSLLKRMSGSELDTNYSKIVYTKLAEDDIIVSLNLVDTHLNYDLKVLSEDEVSTTIDKLDIKFVKRTASGGKIFKGKNAKSMTLIPKETPNPIQEMFISFDDNGNLLEMFDN